MAGGGGGIKKLVINLILDKPVQVYLGGGAALWAIRKVQTRQAYNYHFGKFEFQRQVERHQLWSWSHLHGLYISNDSLSISFWIRKFWLCDENEFFKRDEEEGESTNLNLNIKVKY